MDPSTSSGARKFGTAPVFLTAISTILGAIMFLRFGYAVGNVGFVGAVLIIIMGHLVTVPTAMAVAEIATNQRVEGGGEYFIISRSFGIIIGAAIGIALYLSQAISVAFYIIAFAEAFDPVIEFLSRDYGIIIADKRWISLPGTFCMTALMLTKGADLGVKALYWVVAVLFLSLLMFLAGNSGYEGPSGYGALIDTVENPESLFLVFAICFPAFTGMTAGVGLSGDLKNPRRSIPVGTLAATFAGMFVYVLIAYKLATSAAPMDLVADQLIMSRISLWGPIIPIGLACATLSSALGSFLVAPRTLQAIGDDRVIPWERMSTWLARGRGASNEPVNASLVTAAIAVVFVLMGDVNFVAQIISMFFMVTYGSICLISFLEHFAADPSYRPTFRSRWYVSLFGAVMCGWLMFQMSVPYAGLSLFVMLLLYLGISRFNHDKRGLSSIAQGAIFQISRQLQVFLQKSRKQEADAWRPAIVCLSSSSFERLAAFDLLRWLSHRYGFGTYIHYIEGYLSRATDETARQTLDRLVKLADVSESNVYVDTVISPSYTTAVTQIIQLPGISGKENNMILLEFSKQRPEDLKPILDNYQLIAATGFDVCVLASSPRGFGYHREIHLWLTAADYENASLIILLAYIILGHPDWSGGAIRIFSVVPEESVEEEQDHLHQLVRSGRLPISEHNVEIIPQRAGFSREQLVSERSEDADLVVVGFRAESIRHRRDEVFMGYEGIGNVLFVNTTKEIALGTDEPEQVETLETEETSECSTSDPDEPGASEDPNPL